MDDPVAWLEARDGKRWPVDTTCSIGRAPTNTIMIDDGRVSRRHALVHKQDADYLIIDLGSGNGTYLNGRRVTLSTRLGTGDVLMIGDLDFTFRLDAVAQERRSGRAAANEQTIIQVKSLPAWLLIADIRGSTALAQRMPTTDLAIMIGKWTAACKEIIESNHGAINKYLGDGYFAYWYASADSPPGVGRAMQALVAMQRSGEDPPFRLVLHHGTITRGGGGSGGEDSLSGNEVNGVFRMEKLAGGLMQDVLISEAARNILRDHGVRMRDIGEHEVPQFDGQLRRFYTIV